MPSVTLEEKKTRLEGILACFDRLAVALSGGVDSALLLLEAHAVLGDRLIAITARSPIHPEQELIDAATVAAGLGVPHLVVSSREMELDDFLGNPPERCYLCKQHLFGLLLERLSHEGVSSLAHGANADDALDFRPGLLAAREWGVAAPLMEAGFTKADIRQVARQRGLLLWDKPAMACFATRFAYGDPITPAKIAQVKAAETFLSSLGLEGGRIRHHGHTARIEVPVDRIGELAAGPLRQRMVEALRRIGFLYVALDLEGYVAGKMNRALHDPYTGHRPADGDTTP